MPCARNAPAPTFPRALAALGLALSLACSPGGAGTDVESPFGTPLALGRIPRLTVGVASGDTAQEFHRVVTPFLTRDGHLVVPVAGSSTIRVFNASGEPVRSLGRAGAGPGEFRSLTAAWARGDTIEALDSELERITRFLPDGAVATVQLDGRMPDMSAMGGPLPDGWAVAGVAAGGPGRRDSMEVHQFGFDGADRGTIATVEGFARYAVAGFAGPEPLSPRALMAVRAGRVYVADGLEPRIRVHDPASGEVLEWTWDPGPRPDAAELYDMVIDTAVARSDPATAADIRRRLEGAPVPEHVPVSWGLVVDELGFLWIRAFEPLEDAAALGGLSRGGAGGSWTILSAEGRPLRTVVLPPDFELVQVLADAVVGVARDELGVESVRVVPLTRS